MMLGRMLLDEGQKVVFLILAQDSRKPQGPSEVQLYWVLKALQAVCGTWYTTQQCQEGQIPSGDTRAIVCHLPGEHQDL